ncbi:MAG TPA: TonB-dependent receptor plug domain-containing protein, partial [Anditalea sp.]|nr:TonB-dependent receptor plug domain-containing protein [Anditalea sp.]
MKQQILLGILTFLFSFSLQAQQREVTGKVIDREFGEGIPGVTVSVRGTSRGIVTDIDGNYSLPASAEEYLVFSFIGYNTITELVGNRSIIDVTLEENISDLDAVVVVGYGSQRKADVTGAIVAVDLGPIKGQSMSSGNPMQALQGRVPGLLIEKSGDPSGASSRVLIRGVSTLGNNDPLYVIDGVPTKRQEVFASLNPEAIESIQVLKDASAASIYGSRAANGVIVVTTKRRADGGETLNVTLNSNFSIQNEKRQRYQMLNSRQRGEALWRAMVNDGADPQSGYGEIYDFDWNGDFANPVLNNVSVRPFVGGNPDVPAGDTDWQ